MPLPDSSAYTWVYIRTCMYIHTYVNTYIYAHIPIHVYIAPTAGSSGAWKIVDVFLLFLRGVSTGRGGRFAKDRNKKWGYVRRVLAYFEIE